MTSDAEPARPSMYERFCRAAAIGPDNWRDPEHDLEAIRLATPDEKRAIEQFLLRQGICHFIDAQALALIDTPAARQALLAAFRDGPLEIRAAVAHVAPELVAEGEKLAELLQRIETCDAYAGLDLTLDQIERTHPPQVVAAMLKRIERDPGVAAVHFAALLLYLHGHAASAFDWDQRPFFLRFNPGDEIDRQQAIDELYQRIGTRRS
jgi:hypothetical protein